MDNFFEGPKHQICTFCISADKKELLKFLLASLKTLSNSVDFNGSRIRNSPPLPHPPIRLAATQRVL
jgi:hypothetical protein